MEMKRQPSENVRQWRAASWEEGVVRGCACGRSGACVRSGVSYSVRGGNLRVRKVVAANSQGKKNR